MIVRSPTFATLIGHYSPRVFLPVWVCGGGGYTCGCLRVYVCARKGVRGRAFLSGFLVHSFLIRLRSPHHHYIV